jgi:hypothetical protein
MKRCRTVRRITASNGLTYFNQYLNIPRHG